MKTKEILHQLINHLDDFEKENAHLDDFEMKDFLSYLESKTYRKKLDNKPRKIGGGRQQADGVKLKENNAVLLSRMVSLLYRYAKEYTKKALKDSALQTVEEFSFLIVLMTYDQLSKTELILKNVMSRTSGTEVIKRLLKKGMVKQFADKQDKRSQLVTISSKGLAEMKTIFPKMDIASKIIGGNLSEPEEQTLLFLLKKLEAHHNNLFLNHGDEDLESLLTKKKV